MRIGITATLDTTFTPKPKLCAASYVYTKLPEYCIDLYSRLY